MPATVFIGSQWGDEGKGRFVDWLSASSDIVARYAGGDNAGHTVVVGDVVYKLHLIPSGILHDSVISVLGNGMVINPVNLLKEMDQLADMGVEITPERFMISSRAHIISPAHVEMDKAKEKARGEKAIGTTLRGIGPAYLDKTGRKGITMGQMRNIELFAEALHTSIAEVNRDLIKMDMQPLDEHTATIDYIDAAQRLQPFIRDTSRFLNEQLKAGAKVVCEGAQGTLLDLDHGNYPYVTSSSPTIGGVMTGLGIGKKYIERVIGVAKAFSTRVGSGPFPTELDGEIANKLRGTGSNFWDEFGTTTGRPRRCGWLDTVLLRYACDINGFDELVLTKMDILSGLPEIKVAVAYLLDGERVDYPPATPEELEHAEPVYETLKGWSEDISHIRELDDLPTEAIDYVNRVSELCGVPIHIVSVGPERHQLIEISSTAF